MLRPLSLLFGFGFGLLCSVTACDSGDDGNGDEGPQKNECGTEWAEKDDTTPSIMDDFGAPCSSDADCVGPLGAGSVCVTEILGVYDLPGGFCSRPCTLPNTSTSFEHDSAQCDPDGGVTCVGAQGLFTSCIRECTSDSQCGREGYGCRLMPTLASTGDPKFCLMNTVDCCTTDSGECGD
jgi:hypothetical protein